MFLDKHGERRAPTERFNSKSAASREKIEDARARDRVAQAGKDGSFDAIHGRSHTALGNGQADPAGAAGDHPHGDAIGVAVAVGWGSASSGEVADDGTAGLASSICFFFFFDRFLFPPNKLLSILLRSRPTSRSTKFVIGRSTLPTT